VDRAGDVPELRFEPRERRGLKLLGTWTLSEEQQ
jgi:hypothetical protein